MKVNNIANISNVPEANLLDINVSILVLNNWIGQHSWNYFDDSPRLFTI